MNADQPPAKHVPWPTVSGPGFTWPVRAMALFLVFVIIPLMLYDTWSQGLWAYGHRLRLLFPLGVIAAFFLLAVLIWRACTAVTADAVLGRLIWTCRVHRKEIAAAQAGIRNWGVYSLRVRTVDGRKLEFSAGTPQLVEAFGRIAAPYPDP